MKASDIMSAPVQVVAPADNVAYARNLMIKHKISGFPVLEENVLIGFITKKDIAYRLRQTEPIWRRRPIDRIPVEVLMARNPLTISPETGIHEIANVMIKNDVSGLPVMDGDDLIGIVTRSDLLTSAMVTEITKGVSDLMSPVETASRYHSLDHIIDIMSEQKNRVIVVNNDGSLAGIITESNIAFYTYLNKRRELPEKDVRFLRREETAGRKWFRDVVEMSAVAEDVMSRPVITISSGGTVAEVVGLMTEHRINSVPVVDDRELKGIVARDDIIQELAK